MPAQDKECIRLKYSAPAIKHIPAEHLVPTAKALLIRVCLITGWQLPAEEWQLNILYEQTQKYLRERCANINTQEIEYAFRNKPIDIKDWGKHINLGLFSEVLVPYMLRRQAASELEAITEERLLGVGEAGEPRHMSNLERIETALGLWKSFKSIDFVFDGTYEALVDEKLVSLTDEQKRQYLQAAQAVAANREETDTGFFLVLDKRFWLKACAKKLVVNDYFKSLP